MKRFAPWGSLVLLLSAVSGLQAQSSPSIVVPPTSGPVGAFEASPARSPQNKAVGTLPDLPVVQYVLKNGLTVMLSEDHAVPSVATHLVYLVGSGHEEVGKTGFAHLFEHLMFQGSKHFDQDYFTPFEPIGAEVNGNTNADRTVYYEVVPSQYAELTLWMESDRMRSLLPALSQEKLDNQRDVVKNERRQRYEITPYGMAFWHLDNALYPASHPYQHSTIGSHEDLTAASLDDVKRFFERYYVPANAGLVVVGDFEIESMKSLISTYFDDIPSGKRAEAPQPERPVLVSDVHWIAEDAVQLPRVHFAWLTPGLFEPGDAELDLLSNILTQGKTSRLFKSLVYEQKLAQDVYAYQMSEVLNGAYVIQATAAPKVDPDRLAQALQTELKKALTTEASDSELRRARNDYKKGFFHRLESYESRADLIGAYFLHTQSGDFVSQDFARYQAATAQDVKSAGQKFLLDAHHVRLDFVPGDKANPIKKVEVKP
jgi:zinc protease